MSKKTNTFATETTEELQKLLAEKREALREFRFSMRGSRIRNTKVGARFRKDIARILFRLGTAPKEEVTNN
jgi:ribosomal protein L29